MTDEFTVGDSFEHTVEDVGRADFVKYAGASGDFNPIHYNEPHAKQAGYDSVFGQGMFTAGVASRSVREALGLQYLDEYQTRFNAQVWPGDTLSTTVEITAVSETDEGTRVEADVTVINQDGEKVVTGSAVAFL
jgi:peroxisomal enoyl-CoA hydratase 2